MLHKLYNIQTGASLMFFAILLVFVSTSILLLHLDSNQIRNERIKKTNAALAEAKAALIAYSLKLDLDQVCSTDCPRPGDLPCPDMNNDGMANDGACSDQSRRIGRFPWKTLGVENLRDGYGESLWYAVSNQYKNNPRLMPLNSDTTGSISVKINSGLMINDATSGTGAVAVIFSPGDPILRSDGIQQLRSGAYENDPTHYLDIIPGIEDNAEFVDGDLNGFAVGPSYDGNGNTIMNDSLIVITRENMLPSMEALVLSKVKNELADYFFSASSFPNPADFTNTGCLGNSDINVGNCVSAVMNTPGRLPVDGHTPGWTTPSILGGTASGNWFQQNGWRELIFYAVAPACASGTTNCDGVGMLQINNAMEPPEDDKRVVLISSSKVINTQARTSSPEKSDVANYLEDENLSTADGIYMRAIGNSQTMNDKPVSIQ